MMNSVQCQLHARKLFSSMDFSTGDCHIMHGVFHLSVMALHDHPLGRGLRCTLGQQ